MTRKLKQQTEDEQLAALTEPGERFTASIVVLVEETNATMKVVSQVMERERIQRLSEITQRLELAQAEKDAAIYAEFTARQSAYLARTVVSIEQRSGVSLSSLDLMCGILNGLESSVVDLTVFGTREEVESFIKMCLDKGAKVIREECK